jgi:chromosome segregation ATPase
MKAAQADAEECIAAIQQACDSQLQSLQDSLRQKQQEGLGLEKQLHQTTEDAAQTSLEQKVLQEQFQQVEQTHAQFKTIHQTATKQIEDLKN